MKISKTLILDQKSKQMIQLANKNMTTLGTCGFITCAVVQYISQLQSFTPQMIKILNLELLTPHIQSVMKRILNRRRMQIKIHKIMNDHQRKQYLKNYVANYQIADELEFKIQELNNKQVYFFRQSAYDHPHQLSLVQFQQKNRITQEQQFKGHTFFFSSFGPYTNHYKEDFIEILNKSDRSKPIIIATDTLRHFNITVLFEGEIFILDSLTSYIETKYDSTIVECIECLYRKSLIGVKNE